MSEVLAIITALLKPYLFIQHWYQSGSIIINKI